MLLFFPILSPCEKQLFAVTEILHHPYSFLRKGFLEQGFLEF